MAESDKQKQFGKGLSPGEKYLNLSLGGKTGIRIALFPNKRRKAETDPHFVGSIPLACWVSKKRVSKVEVESVL